MLFYKSVKITTTVAAATAPTAAEEEFDNFICSTAQLTMYATQPLPFIAFAQRSFTSFVSECCQQLRCDKLACGTWRTHGFTQKVPLVFVWCFSRVHTLLSSSQPVWSNFFTLHHFIYTTQYSGMYISACSVFHVISFFILPKYFANARRVRSDVKIEHAIIFW